MTDEAGGALLRLRLGALLAGALLAAGCAHEDPIEMTLDAAVQAAEDRSADDFAELVSGDFRGGGQSKDELVAMVRRYFAAYDALDVGVSNLKVEQKGDFAHATFEVRLTGVPTKIGGLGDLVPDNARYDIDLQLREHDGRWLIAQASWVER